MNKAFKRKNQKYHNFRKIVARLNYLANGGEPLDLRKGICHEFEFPEYLFESWQYYSGNPGYPVPVPYLPNVKPCPVFQCNNEFFLTAPNEVDIYWDTENLWVGAYGDLRRDLCKHLAAELERRYL